MSYMFAGCRNLQTFSGIEYFNTTNVTNMAHMFEGCNMNGWSFNLTNFNTHNVENMSAMFKDCRSLVSLHLEMFNTERVTDMSEMFRDCTSLENLYLQNLNNDNFDLSNVVSLTNMCTNIATAQAWKHCTIDCKRAVWTKLTDEDSYTGIDLNKVRGNIVDE